MKSKRKPPRDSEGVFMDLSPTLLAALLFCLSGGLLLFRHYEDGKKTKL